MNVNRIVGFGVSIVLASCAGVEQDCVLAERVDGVRIIVSTESEVIGGPVDIATDDLGRLYVLDRFLAHVIHLSPSGEVLRTIGTEGRGPGEFLRPRKFALGSDTLFVADLGNDRLQAVALASGFIRTAPLPPAADMGDVAVHKDGSVLVSTLGRQGSLAIRHDPAGHRVVALGSPPVPAVMMLDFRGMKREIVDGTVPALFRNGVLPVFAPDGGAWLILNGEARIDRYDAADSLQWSVHLEVPELASIWLDVVERARATLNNPRQLSGLAYVMDAVPLGDALWILLNMPTEPAVMLSVSPTGVLQRRIRFTDVVGAQNFAIDRERHMIYFTIPEEASVVAARWPADGRSPQVCGSSAV